MVEGQLEIQGVELEEVWAELAATQTEVAHLAVESSKHREDALMKVSRLQARAEAVERKAAKDAEEVVAAKAIVLSEYQSSTEFEQVYGEQYDEGVQAFMYNFWGEHLEWDLSFLGEVVRAMVAEFNEPRETPLNDPPVELMPLADQSPQVTDQPPLVINEDSPTVDTSGGGGADEDDEVVQIDNPTEVLSFEDHPPSDLN